MTSCAGGNAMTSFAHTVFGGRTCWDVHPDVSSLQNKANSLAGLSLRPGLGLLLAGTLLHLVDRLVDDLLQALFGFP